MRDSYYKKWLIPIYLLGMIGSIILSVSTVWVLANFMFVFIYGVINNKYIKINKVSIILFLFIMYYFIVTLVGTLIGTVNIIDIINFLIKYVCIPYTVYSYFPNRDPNKKQTFIMIKNIILFTIMYGCIESVLEFNFLTLLIRVDQLSINNIWIENLLNVTSIYKPSSLFLHYTYYALIILFGVVINFFIPYKKKISNIIFYAISIIQLYATQSRIGWIVFLLIIFIYILNSRYKMHINKLYSIIISLVFIGIIYFTYKNSIDLMLDNIYVRFRPLFTGGLEYGSLGQRVGTLLNYSKYFLEEPMLAIFGAGYGSITNMYLPNYSYFRGYSTADSMITIYLVETGIIGIIILAISILLLSRLKIRRYSEISYYLLWIFALGGITFDLFGNYLIILFVSLPICYILKDNYKRKLNTEHNIKDSEIGFIPVNN